MIPHRWVDPEFEDGEDMIREEAATGTEGEEEVTVKDSREVVNNLREEEEEIVIVHMEMDSI